MAFAYDVCFYIQRWRYNPALLFSFFVVGYFDPDFIIQIMEIHIFWGDLTNSSAKKEPLARSRCSFAQTDTLILRTTTQHVD